MDHDAALRLVGDEARTQRVEVGGQELADMAREVEGRLLDILLELIEVLGAGRALRSARGQRRTARSA